MSKKRRVEPRLECIAYVSVEAELNRVEKLESKQERYIREYANAHNIDIVAVEYRHGFGQMDVNRQINDIARLISLNKVQGIIVSNIERIIPKNDLVDAYKKIGIIKSVGGKFISVENNGDLDLGICLERN